MNKDLGGGTSRAIEQQNILVVDDETDIRHAVRDTIEAYLEHVSVFTANSGQNALELLKTQPVDLIITDYRMPGMNGIEFLNEARQMYPTVPAIMITAYPDIDLAIRALQEAHITNFIPKPLRRENIVVVVASTLHERRKQILRNTALAGVMSSLHSGIRELRQG
jgi:two-component system, NtrC family, response regulator